MAPVSQQPAFAAAASLSVHPSRSCHVCKERFSPNPSLSMSLPSSPMTINQILHVIDSRARADTASIVSALQNVTPSARTAAAILAAALLATGTPTSLQTFSDAPVQASQTEWTTAFSTQAILPAPALAEVPDEAPLSPLVDDAGVVSRGSEQIFSKAVSAIASRTGTKIHFVIVRSLPFGDTPADFASELATQWKLGDDDVLFAASVKLARAGVYVGDTVKKLLPEDLARSVAEETYGFPAGDEKYGTALVAVTNRLIPVLNGEADPGPPASQVREVVQNFKTKKETKNDRDKYVKIVGGVLVISVVAPLIQTYWYVKDD